MKNVVKFVIYIIMIFLLCYLKNIVILGSLFLIGTIFSIIKKIQISKMELFSIIFLILCTFAVNILSGKMYALLIVMRILDIYLFTKIYTKNLSVLELVNVIEIILSPLKILKINTRNIGIIVSISITVLPIMLNEIKQKINALYSKGMKLNIGSIKIIFKSILVSTLIRCNEMEKSLSAAGWN